MEQREPPYIKSYAALPTREDVERALGKLGSVTSEDARAFLCAGVPPATARSRPELRMKHMREDFIVRVMAGVQLAEKIKEALSRILAAANAVRTGPKREAFTASVTLQTGLGSLLDGDPAEDAWPELTLVELRRRRQVEIAVDFDNPVVATSKEASKKSNDCLHVLNRLTRFFEVPRESFCMDFSYSRCELHCIHPPTDMSRGGAAFSVQTTPLALTVHTAEALRAIYRLCRGHPYALDVPIAFKQDADVCARVEDPMELATIEYVAGVIEAERALEGALLPPPPLKRKRESRDDSDGMCLRSGKRL